MQLKAVVQYEGGWAHYDVSPESHGIYQARLLRFEGSTDRPPPPEELILVRGYRQWSGSYERQELLNEIGNFIESKHIIHPSETNLRPDRKEAGNS